MSKSSSTVESRIVHTSIKVPDSELADDRLITEVDQLNSRCGDKITPSIIDSHIAWVRFIYVPNTTLTICVIGLKNGWTVTGESAAMDDARYDRGLGETFSYANARGKAASFIAYAKTVAMHDCTAEE